MSTMYPGLYLKAKTNGTVVSLHAAFENTTLLGASIRSDRLPGYRGKIISFMSRGSALGVIAVVCRSTKGVFPFFVKTSITDDPEYADSCPWIHIQDKDEAWIPPAHKMAHINENDASLSVQIAGRWYTTSKEEEADFRLPVSAGNLICSYLATEDREQERLMAEEIKRLAAKLTNEEYALQSIKEKLRDLQKLNDFLGAKVENQGNLLLVLKGCLTTLIMVATNKDEFGERTNALADIRKICRDNSELFRHV